MSAERCPVESPRAYGILKACGCPLFTRPDGTRACARGHDQPSDNQANMESETT